MGQGEELMYPARANIAKSKLAEGGIVTALGQADDPDLIDMIGPTGIEAAWLEAEHGPVDFADIGNLSRACDLWGMSALVRVTRSEPGIIYRSLDRGAHGIVVPHVRSREEAELVVDSAKFAPIGNRGVAASRLAYGDPDYFFTANDATTVIVMIEDIPGIENLDEILKVDHIDVFFIAPGDLAQGLGHHGNVGHPEVQQVIDDSLARIIAAGRTAGALATKETVGKYIDAGVRFFYTSMKHWIADGAAAYLDATK
jgi:2-keto-3-deoxy-L-rhamnonate aldolase RhmA